MKRPNLLPALAAATLILTTGSLRGADESKAASPAAKPQDEPRRSAQREGGPAPRTSRADQLLKRFDKNNDGKLDEAELADAHEAMLQEQMDRQAAQAARAGAEPFRRRMLELFDKNHDGRLDHDERAAARLYAEEHGLGENGQVREELMRRFDKNADGKLDDSERAELMKFLQERRTEMAATPPAGAAAEKARLDAIAAEVAKRKAEREKRAQEAAPKP